MRDDVFTEGEDQETLQWIPIDGEEKYYPEFFRQELLHPAPGIKYFLNDERVERQ